MAYRRTTVSRDTGATVTVATAADLGLDSAGGRWVTVCETHSTVCNHATLALARSHASRCEWCEECRDPTHDAGAA
jgi:hypothetical protein